MAKATQDLEVGDSIVTVPLCSVEQRIHIAEAIAPYLAPKLKNMEITGDVKQDYNINVKHFVIQEAFRESPYVSDGEMKRLMDASIDDALKDPGEIATQNGH